MNTTIVAKLLFEPSWVEIDSSIYILFYASGKPILLELLSFIGMQIPISILNYKEKSNMKRLGFCTSLERPNASGKIIPASRGFMVLSSAFPKIALFDYL